MATSIRAALSPTLSFYIARQFLAGFLLILAGLALWFVRHALQVWNSEGFDAPRAMFRYSILHLFLIFVVLLGDHYLAPFFL